MKTDQLYAKEEQSSSDKISQKVTNKGNLKLRTYD